MRSRYGLPSVAPTDREGGDLSRGYLTTRRVWFLANLAITVALLPALFTEGEAPSGPVAVQAGDTLATVPVVASRGGDDALVDLAPSEVAAEAATTTTTTAPPTTTTTVAAPEPEATTTITVARKVVARPTTTTTAPTPKPAPEPTTTATPAEDGTEAGKASWYDHEAGVCAHKSLPFGTVVTVTHTGNGKTTTCTVGDRGPYIEGWIIDLHPEQFEDLAPRSAGVIPVRISW